MLSRYLRISHVQIGKEVKNFEEAIEVSMAPLIASQDVTAEYVKTVKRIYTETGPYIVITKHIALPHAPSDSGANRVSMGFLKLKTPVISGNEANDPVKYLFPLSAPDSESHLGLMAELAELLGDENFIHFLDEVESPEAFIEYIREKE